MQSIEQIYRHNGWWVELNFSQLERDVRRLQGRIYRASKKDDKKGVCNLMKLLVRSETAKLFAIYLITQKNEGRRTPGIDGKVYLTPEERMELGKEQFDYRTYRFQPVLRRYIPKSTVDWRSKRLHRRRAKPDGVKLRPLGMMTIKDRIMTTILSFALTAKWEAILEPNVMGFRPGRSTQDAMLRIYHELDRKDRVILDADLKGFFDTIRHDAILNRLSVFSRVIKRCLKAGIIDRGKLQETTRGIVQGSPISPVLANIALHGLQRLFGAFTNDGRYLIPQYKRGNDKNICVIRYADDFVITAPSKHIIEGWVLPKLRRFLEKRGIQLNEDKTKIITKKEGFNFLGFTIEKPRRKLYMRPQDEKIKKFLNRLRDIVWSNKQVEQRKLIRKLNPVLRGWAMYYRYSDANRAFEIVDYELWNLLWRWSKRRHPHRGKRWILHKYFGKIGGVNWMFRDKKTGYSIIQVKDIKRLEYKFIVGTLSPYDPDPKVKQIWERKGYEEIRHAMI
jgi:RNA-directed DNA polymerase